jgi:tRNA/rRNA methyltransferase
MERLRVVLIRPRIAANIGAVARVMRNFGANQLTLVSPAADAGDPRARLLATHAEDLLSSATIANDLSEAVADCVMVAGTSARRGGLFRRQSVGLVADVAPLLVQSMASGAAAIVFGPETSGLTDEEVTRCHCLMHIATDGAHPALNLAQAVAICLYEVHRAWFNHGVATISNDSGEPLASFAAQEHMFCQLQESLKAIHFLYGDKADSLMHGVRHLLGKARLSEMEVKLLLGLARQMKWIAKGPS